MSTTRLPQARLVESIGLARAITLDVVAAEIVPVNRIRPTTYIGVGAVDQFKRMIVDKQVILVILDCQLSPAQQRNLEQIWNIKVIDRTALILEIFGERAYTREGALQVELAHLSYQRSRLVRSWTHLERQRGGFGFIGGPGETQIEVDRRLISNRISKLQRELDKVRRTRSLHRRARCRVPYPVVALVGYTNAGKSTLFNRLAQANVAAADQLFSTLDPTMRSLRLPSGRTVILSDTVGFISNLPHELVAAFRATLEEVISADIVVHVRDIVHPDSIPQREDVEAVLCMLGLDRTTENRWIEIYNKIDLLESETRQDMVNSAYCGTRFLPLSAVTGEGIMLLLNVLDSYLARALSIEEITIPVADGATLSWLYSRCEILNCQEGNSSVHMQVRLSVADRARLYARLHSSN